MKRLMGSQVKTGVFVVPPLKTLVSMVLSAIIQTATPRMLKVDSNILSKITSFGVILLLGLAGTSCGVQPGRENTMSDPIQLPSPAYKSDCDVNRALHERRSSREYVEGGVSLAEVAQLLWSAQGVTTLGGFRTAPSAGGLYPLETYLVAGVIDDLDPGVYKYDPHTHTLSQAALGDKRAELSAACLGQDWMSSAPAMIAFAAVYERTTSKYGERGKRYVHMEVGHAGENVSLAAVAMRLGTVVVAAFDDEEVKKVLELPEDETPLSVMPVGRK